MPDGDDASLAQVLGANPAAAARRSGDDDGDLQLPPGMQWLNHPSQIDFLNNEVDKFEADDPYFFASLNTAADDTIRVKPLYMCSLLKVSHIKYKPAKNAFTRSAANNGSNDGNIERIIWVVDVFGNTGFNMAAIVLQRGQSDSILYGNDRTMRNREDAGKKRCTQ